METAEQKADREANRAAFRYVRWIFVAKLLLFGVVAPLAVISLYELRSTLFRSEVFDSRTTPLLFGSSRGFVSIISGFFFLGLFCIVPFFGELFGKPMFSIATYLTCYAVGLLLDVLLVVPRIFLGSFIDSVLLRAEPTSGEVLLSRKTSILLVLLTVGTMLAAGLVLGLVHREWVARGREYFQEQKVQRMLAGEDWDRLKEHIKDVESAQTIEAAVSGLTLLKSVAANFKALSERRKFYVLSAAGSAEDHLLESLRYGRTSPEEWKPRLKEDLRQILLSLD